MDLTVTDYPDRAALNHYMRGSAEVIGLQMLPVLGTVSDPHEAEPYAAALGQAFQLTNFLRDVDEDLMRKRVYLPADELAAHGVDRELSGLVPRSPPHRPTGAKRLGRAARITREIYRFAAAGIAAAGPAVAALRGNRVDAVLGDPGPHRGIDFAVFSHRATVGNGATAAGRRRRAVPVVAGASARQRRADPVQHDDRWQYLILLGVCLADHRTPGVVRCRRLPAAGAHAVAAILPVAVVFLVWDAIAIAAGVWTYNSAYVTGIDRTADIPIEEVLFFVVIPLCGLLTYNAVSAILDRSRRR